MAKRAPYSVLPRSRMRRVVETTDLHAAGLYACLYASELVHGLPGVTIAGPAALAEHFRLGVAKARALLLTLEGAGWIQADVRAPLIFVCDAIADDPAANPNVVEFAWFPRFRQLPESPVKDAIERAIGGSLKNQSLAKWAVLTNRSPLPLSPTVTVDGSPQPLSQTVGGNPIPDPLSRDPVIPERSDGVLVPASGVTTIEEPSRLQPRVSSDIKARLERAFERGTARSLDDGLESLDAIAKRATG